MWKIRKIFLKLREILGKYCDAYFREILEIFSGNFNVILENY